MKVLGFIPTSELDSHVERIAKLEQELVYADRNLLEADTRFNQLTSTFNEHYESEWKLTKDGTKRYRKVATKVLVTKWKTESQPLIEVIV